ncbi:MAG: glycerol-3-phosphate 1-O-acyltransferase PlsY [Candidatus Tantalella remota]|nr:glycerol-3-phosphate 1-O-acyltransferase PlsY [Candidatus Tantalella remota]
MMVVLSIVTAYILGSVPTAYIFGKVLKGIDVREYGSGNVGATNVFRTVGKVPGIIVLVIDFLKGYIAVTLLPYLAMKYFVKAPAFDDMGYIMLGAAVISGHVWTCFLRFKGGKGVATTAGVMAGLFPVIFLCGLVIWVIIFSIWKYVSLASISAAACLPVFALVFDKGLPVILFCSVLALVGVTVHKANIKRLIQGKEKRLVRGEKS